MSGKAFRKILVYILLVTMLTGCATTASQYERTHDGEVESSSETQDVPGFKQFLTILGTAVIIGAIFAYAPPEAYD
ncbi:MAG: hypothetical protein D3917_02840 [Candidatus Electrothrix sp. AX5]|nr:hypothetical protein [Candidatus Electrothrix sp. AX5]